MKKLYIALILLLLLVLGLWYRTDGKPVASKVSAMKRMQEIGPVVDGVDVIENFGTAVLHISADRIFVTKTKMMGFDTTIKKKPVALYLDLQFTKQNKIVLFLHKDRAVFDLNNNMIVLTNPVVRYPPSIGQPDIIKINRKARKIYIYKNNQSKEFDFNVQNLTF